MRPWIHEVVSLARTTDPTADTEILALLLDEKSATGWEHYLTSGDLHFFRRHANDGAPEEVAPEEPAATISCANCGAWSAMKEGLGRCAVSGSFSRSDMACEFGYTQPDQWKATATDEPE